MARININVDRPAMPPPRERPTMAELAAQSNGVAPWTCPVCGCRDWRTLDTKEAANGNITRTRYCRHCGKGGPRIYTEESPYRTNDSDSDAIKDCA